MGIELTTINSLRQAYAALPEKERIVQTLSVRDVVRLLADEITALKARGYSTDEIVQVAASHNIQISANTLRKYLGDLRQESTKSKRKSRAVQAGVTPTLTRKA